MSAYSETVNVIMKSRVRESCTHGSVRGWYREVSVCSPNPFIKRYTISTTPAQLIRAKARAIEIVNHSLIYA